MFTTGRIIFTLAFLAAFIIALVWSFRKERSINNVHYAKNYKIVLGVIAFLTLLFLIVKLRKFL